MYWQRAKKYSTFRIIHHFSDVNYQFLSEITLFLVIWWKVTPELIYHRRYSEKSIHFTVYYSEPYNWIDNLPLTLLSIRNVIKEDLGCSPSELAFGITTIIEEQYTEAQCISQLETRSVQAFKDKTNKLPFTSTRRCKKQSCIPKDLLTCEYVFFSLTTR